MENQKIAQIFQEIGDILELQGDSVFRIRSYHKAAQVISNYPRHLRDIYEKDPKLLDDIPGVGKALMEKIIEILETGDCRKHIMLVKKIKPGLLNILRLRGIGPKKTKLFYDELGIDSVVKLQDAAWRGLLQALPGMGEKSEAAVLAAIEAYGRLTARMPIHEALETAEEIAAYMKKKAKKVEYAGSLRRRRETIGDIDILACGGDEVVEHFCKFPAIEHVEAKGSTKATVVLESGVQVDLRVVEEASFGAALYYFTGSKAHNIAARKIAQKMGLKIKGEKSVAGKTEEEIFKKIKLPYIIPEMREDTGEIEFMKKNPDFRPIEMKDIKGELHCHTDWSDSSASLSDVAKTAKKCGYEYLAVTDHSSSLKIAHGLSLSRLEAQMREIDKLNKKLSGIKLLKGIEVDVLRDGSLDTKDDVLAELDIVVASIHTGFTLSSREQTARIIRAFENPHVNIFAHPTGGKVGHRESYDVDIDKVMRAAKKHSIALELNCHPTRLDLDSKNLRAARDLGIKIAFGTDAHNASELDFMKYGVYLGRRGWLERTDVLNTMSWSKLKKVLDG